MQKKITFADIAAYTHFSKTTISRYFNDPDSLTLENQNKIAAALDTLGYQQNKLAKVLANGKSEFVGIIIPNLYLHYYAEILNQIISSYKEYHYKFLVFISDSSPETERQYIQELMAYKIEGLIVMSHALTSEELASYHLPIVGIEREDEHISSISTDNYMGAVQATSLLIRSGCTRLLHINVVVPKEVPAYGRISGFLDTCEEHHVPHELFTEDLGVNFASTKVRLQAIFDRIEEQYHGEKLGVFLANDTYANIFLNLVVRKYGCLPPNYQIVGFDDSPDSQEAIFPITTVGQQIDKLAAEAMAVLVPQMAEMKKRNPQPQTTPEHRIITPVLIRRETTD